jgi:hypothetical protein
MCGKRVPDDLVDENPGQVVDVAVFIPPAQRLDNPYFCTVMLCWAEVSSVTRRKINCPM